MCVLSHSVVFNSLQPHGLQTSRLLCSWTFTGKNTRMGSRFPLQRVFLTQDQIRFFCFSCLSRQSLYHQCHLGSPYPAHTDRIKFKRKIIQRVFFSSYNECCDACFLNLDLVETYSETKSCMKEFY